METISNYLFDLDGTITNPKNGILGSVRHALRELGREIPDEKTLELFIGPPLKDSFAEYCGMDAQTADLAVLKYREFYVVNGIYDCYLYPGMEQTLSTLQKRGARLFIATSKPQPFAEMICDHFAISRYFTKIVGSGLHGERDTKLAVIRCVLSEFDIEPSTAVMIGDRKYDILPAAQLSMKSVAVTYGYGSRAELEAAAPTRTIDDIRELL